MNKCFLTVLFYLSLFLIMTGNGCTERYAFPPDDLFDVDTVEYWAVRAILDSNGLSNYQVKDVATVRDRHVVEFYISQVDLSILPHDIERLNYLERIYILVTNLKTLPPEFYRLQNLKLAYIAQGPLESISDSIVNLVNLKELILRWDSLTSIPAGIGAMSQLTYLDLSHNKLTTLPDSILNIHPNILVDANRLCSLSIELKSWLNYYCENKWDSSQYCP